MVTTIRLSQSSRALEGLFDRMRRWIGDDTFLQVDDDESGFGVDGGNGHSALQATTSGRLRGMTNE